MSQIEYLVALISIIVGLGLADLAQSLRELVRPDRTVRWHWLPLSWAAIVFLTILQLWWASFRTLQNDLFGDVMVFLPYLLLFLILYLACSFALPDADWDASSYGGDETLDLEAFYFSPEHRRWFFGIMALLLVLGQGFNTALALLSDTVPFDLPRRVLTIGSNLAISSLFVTLIFTRRRWVHAGVTVPVFGIVLYTLGFQIPPL